METRELTEQELDNLSKQGVDITPYKGVKVQVYGVNDSDTSSIPQAVGHTLETKAGRIIGGGLGSIPGVMAGAEIGALGGPAAPITVPLGGIIGGIITGALGGGAGQKIQEGVEGDEVAKRLNEEQSKIEEEHPYATGLTESAGTMLAGGMRPGFNGLKNVIGNGLLNAGIGAGANLVTGQPITAKQLTIDAATGAVFNTPTKWAGRLMGHTEPTPEPTKSDDVTPPENTAPKSNISSPWIHQDEDGNPLIDDKGINQAYGSKLNPQPKRSDFGEDYAGYQQAATEWRRKNGLPVEDKRNALHEDFLSNPPVMGPKIPEGDIQTPLKMADETAVKGPATTEDILGKPAENPTPQPNQPQTFADAVRDYERANYRPSNEELPETGSEEDEEDIATKQREAAKQARIQKEADYAKMQAEGVSQKYNDTENPLKPITENQARIIDPKTLLGNNLDRPNTPHVDEEGNPIRYSLGSQSDYQNLIKQLQELTKQGKFDEVQKVWKQIEDFKNNTGTQNATYKALLDKYVSGIKGDKPDVSIIHDPNMTVKGENGQHFGVQGKTQNGKITLNTAHIKDGDDFMRVLREEHNHLLLDTPEGKTVIAKAIEQGIGKDTTEKLKTQYGNLSPEDAMHEFIAKEGSKDQTFMQKIIQPVKEWLASKGLYELKDDEVARALLRTLKKGGESEQARYSLKSADEKHNRIKGYVSNIDNIRKLNHPSASLLADAFQQALQRNDENVGQTWNKVAEVAKGITKQDMDKIDAALDYERINKSPAPTTMLNRKQRQVFDAWKQAYDLSGKRNIADKVPVYVNGKPRLLKQDPFSAPTPIKAEVAKTIRENVDSDAITELNKQYLDNAVRLGYSKTQAQDALDRIHTQLQGKSSTGSSTTPVFAGSRLPKGIPLPKEWTGNFMQRTEAYFRRNAMDNAFYKHVESDPKAWAALGNTQDAWGKNITPDPNGSLQNNAHVQSQLNEFNGVKGGSPTERALSSAAAQAFIANPGIELHKIGSNEISMFSSYIDNPKQFFNVLKSSVNALSTGIQHATENGIVKMTARSVSDVLDKNATFVDRLRGLALGINKIATLGDFTNRFATGLLQAQGEALLPDKVRLANGGNKGAQLFMKRLDPTYAPGKNYSPQDISKLSSVLAGYIHGTHDGRTMPMWMQGESELSGFAQLAHWSVAQTSRFMNDIVNQAKVGNYKPLIFSTLGSVLGGMVIKDLREKIQGKDGQIPSIQEILSTNNPKKSLLSYNLVSAAQYAGFAGLGSTAIRSAFDLAYKNHPQGFTFPLDEIATDMGSQISQFTSAAANDPTFNWGEASIKLVYNMLAHNFQLAKIGLNQGINNGLITGEPAEKKALSDKLNQLRRFDMVQGLPYEEPEPSTANPYMDMESKRFRNTQDVGEAAKKIEPLIKEWMEASKENPDIIFSKLKGLKNAKYDTMPSMESEPLEFQRFYNFLKSTKGDAYASQYLEDYMRHKIINEAKGGLVP